MKVVSVNVGKPQEVEWKDTLVTTGIFKEPVQGPVMIRELNLDGDEQADLTVHGGAEKAVYGYASEHYEYWKQELPGVKFPWGKFGENLTTEGLFEDTLHIGDRLQVGSAVLTVTQPRLPCYKLTVRFNRDDMIKRFLAGRRSGFYFSVAEEGEVQTGSEIEILSRDPNRVRVADISQLYFSKDVDHELLERAIKVRALPESWRDELVARAQSRQRS